MGATLDVLVCLAALVPGVLRLQELGLEDAAKDTAFASSPEWWYLFAGISLLFAVRVLIWQYPARARKACKGMPLRVLGSDPVTVFSRFEAIGKVLLMGVVYHLLGDDGRDALADAVNGAPKNVQILAAVSIAAGLLIGLAAYKSVGVGAYGAKLGKRVTSSDRFPFNLGLRHPLYVGAVLTIAGALPLAACETLVSNGFVHALIATVAMYGALGRMESSDDAPSAPKKPSAPPAKPAPKRSSSRARSTRTAKSPPRKSSPPKRSTRAAKSPAKKKSASPKKAAPKSRSPSPARPKRSVRASTRSARR